MSFGLALGAPDGAPFVKGDYTAGDNTAEFIAYLDGGEVRLIVERQDLGEYGSGWTAHWFDGGALRRHQRWSRILSQAGAPSDGWYEQTYDLRFADGRYLDGTKTVNGEPAEPDEHEVRGAARTGEDMLARAQALID